MYTTSRVLIALSRRLHIFRFLTCIATPMSLTHVRT